MSRTAATLRDMYDALLARFGPQHWWPGDTPTEVMIGAILTQNTAWRNVERAIANLQNQGLVDLAGLHATPVDQLAELIRPAGYYNIKARRLKNLVAHICENYAADLDAFFDKSTHPLRDELLSLNGIGRETADAIVLYAAGKATFVVDAYTARILRRHLLIDDSADYDQIKDLFESALPADARMYNEYHALIVACGKDCCRPTARCQTCPLAAFDHDPALR